MWEGAVGSLYKAEGLMASQLTLSVLELQGTNSANSLTELESGPFSAWFSEENPAMLIAVL